MKGRVSLSAQLLGMQVAIVLAVLSAAGLLAFHLQQQQIRDTYSGRVLDIARSLAVQPAVREAYSSDDPTTVLQPLARLVRSAAGAEFVVFTDRTGIRYTHPDPAKIGLKVSTDPSIALAGGEFVGTETGTLGRSLRAKVPVRDNQGEIQGQISVGILESELSADLFNVLPRLVTWLTGSAMVGFLGAIGVTKLIRRRIYGLEPEEIVELLQAREAMLHGIREGVVAVDDRGRLALVNDEAMRLLGLEENPTRQLAAEVLDQGGLVPLLNRDDDFSDNLVQVGDRVLVVNSTVATVSGRPVGRVLVLRDRTELTDALLALEGQRTITDALQAQAHEFSNKLHVLSGLIELGRSEEAVKYIDRVGGGTGPGLDLHRIKDPAAAALLVSKAAIARGQGITLRLEIDSHTSGVLGVDVVTVLANLIDNATEASRPGDDIEVLLVQKVNKEVLIRVSDEGKGVPPAMHERIFERGVSSKTTSMAQEGRGIGLSLVSSIADRSGGTILLEDRKGGGSIFTAVLPVTTALTYSATHQEPR